MASRPPSSICERSPRSTSRRPRLARHCSRVLIVHEDSRTGGIGESLAAIIQEEAFESLDAPIRILGALDTPVPYAPPLEEFFLVGEAGDRAGCALVGRLLTGQVRGQSESSKFKVQSSKLDANGPFGSPFLAIVERCRHRSFCRHWRDWKPGFSRLSGWSDSCCGNWRWPCPPSSESEPCNCRRERLRSRRR